MDKVKKLRWLWLSLLVIALDQLTKHVVVSHMSLGQLMEVFPFFGWTLAYNYGAAFSFLHDAGGWQRWFFAGIALAVSVGVVWWLTRLPERGARFLACALALVLGGAIGNLYDRMTLGYVVDFILVHYQGWNFPAFNVADSAITVGAIMLVIDAFFLEKKRKSAAT